MADKRPPRPQEEPGCDSTRQRKRAKHSVPACFSLDSVVASCKRVALENAHLPANSMRQLFDQDANVVYLTEDRASWVYCVPGWYRCIFKHAEPADLEDATAPSEPDDAWAALFERAWRSRPESYDSIVMFGKLKKLPRLQLLCGEVSSYRYSGRSFSAQKEFPPALRRAVQHMQHVVVDPETQRSQLSAGLVNWYADGDQYIGPHADDERDLVAQSPIVALSLGATRRFVFTRKTSSNANATDQNAIAKLELSLEDGDLLVMGGTTQQTHKHALPKMKRCRERRISVTMRCFR